MGATSSSKLTRGRPHWKARRYRGRTVWSRSDGYRGVTPAVVDHFAVNDDTVGGLIDFEVGVITREQVGRVTRHEASLGPSILEPQGVTPCQYPTQPETRAVAVSVPGESEAVAGLGGLLEACRPA